MLAKLQNEQPVKNVEIVTLSFHVDYWNYLGWKDEFSSAKYSERQKEYVRSLGANGSYTPQMVVDGKYEFVGSKYSTALKELGKASEKVKGQVKLTLKKELLNPSLNVQISDLETNEDSDIWLAVAEDKITSDVERGENSGKKLSHISVVRDLKQIGFIATGEDKFETEKTIELDSKWATENLSFVVFVQNKNSNNIVAVGKAKLK